MEYKLNGSNIVVSLQEVHIDANVGESAKLDVQAAITYIESGKAELSPLVAAAKGYKESAETAAGEALNSAERAEAAASSIPTVNDATLTIQVNSVDLQTFTANSATNATANIAVPTDTGDLTNGAGFLTSSALSGYATTNYVDTADDNLQSQIDAITASSGVTDIVGTYAELQAYDTSSLTNNSIIKVLQDESRDDETTYYRWVITGGVGAWVLIGEEGPYYTKSQADSTFVPQTRTVNNKALSSNITLSYSDVGADASGAASTAETNAKNYADGLASNYATAAQGALADTALQPNDNISELVNDVGYTTNTGTVTSVNNVPPVNGDVTLTIPPAQVNSDWNAVSGVAEILNKPTIPTVNNATITFTQGGTTKGTITLNQSSNQTIAFDAGGGGGTVDQTYNSTSSNAQSGTAIAGAGFLTSSALSGYATETWVGNQGYQLASNIATTLTSTLTDSQYPSAKLFYDTCGDIESAINTIRGV